jgi:DNA polymerase IV
MNKTILHLDFDSFFASVEQQFEPHLRDRPMGVTAKNGRTCIIASSREAKKFGIKTGTRTFDALKLCPSFISVPADFEKYGEVSKKFIKICDEFSPTIEVFSIDEVFMDVTLTARLFGGVYPLIEKFKSRLREELGDYITASVGISHNKLLAKLASGLKKPNGVMAIAPEDVIRVYNEAKLTDICGIGRRIEDRLHNLGIYTLLKLRLTPLSSLIAEFGDVEGRFLYNIGWARDDRPLVHYTDADEVKSVGRQYCLPQNEYDMHKVMQNVYELCEEVGRKLRRIGKKTKTVGIYLGGENSIHGRRTLDRYIDDGKEIFEECLEALNFQFPISNVKFQRRIGNYKLEIRNLKLNSVRRISIWTGNLEDAANVPSPLFIEERNREKVVAVVDKINEKFGHYTIRNGFLLNAPKLKTVPNGYAGSILS